MRKLETMIRFGKCGAAAFALFAGLAFAPAPAQAQVCGDLDDIAEDLLVAYFDELADFFTLSEKSCDAMTSTFFKACNTAVKDAVKCLQRQIGEIPKAAKPGCREAAKNPSSCESVFKDQAKLESGFVEDEAQFAYGDCESAADEFWDVCRFGP